MARSGNYLYCQLNGRPFLEHPPLYYLVCALFSQLFKSETEIPFRLGSLLFGALSLFFTFAIMTQKKGLISGLMAAGILASSVSFFKMSRWLVADIATVCSFTFALFSYLRLSMHSERRYTIGLGLAIGLSFLTKGLVGPAMILASLFMDLWIRQLDRNLILKIFSPWMISFALLPLVLWILGLYRAGGWPFIQEAIVVNNLMRFMGISKGALLGHQNGIFFYWNSLPLNMLPWSLLLIPAFIHSIKNYKDNPFLSWVLAPLILLSLSSTKRGVYLTPLNPVMACILAEWLLATHRKNWEKWFLRITLGFGCIACFAPFIGIFYGSPLLSASLGVISLTGLGFLLKNFHFAGLKEIRIVLIICLAFFSSGTVFYKMQKPENDNLEFAKQAVRIVGVRPLKLLNLDESSLGLFSLVQGKTVQTVTDPQAIREDGFYVWRSRGTDFIRGQLDSLGKVDIILEKSGQSDKLTLAYLDVP